MEKEKILLAPSKKEFLRASKEEPFFESAIDQTSCLLFHFYGSKLELKPIPIQSRKSYRLT
jgi:hypothetical protein